MEKSCVIKFIGSFFLCFVVIISEKDKLLLELLHFVTKGDASGFVWPVLGAEDATAALWACHDGVVAVYECRFRRRLGGVVIMSEVGMMTFGVLPTAF